MGIYEVIPVGEKLKKMREKYKMKQEDLTGGEVTRNLISQIEHSKARLTKSTGEIIFKNLNRICKERHIKVDESIEYLMEDEKSQANKILDRYITELKDLSVYKNGVFISKLNEVEEFLVYWDIKDKKITIFELAGDYYCSINDFYNSSIYYEKAKALIDINIHNKNIVSILRKLSMVYFYMGKYEEDIKCCNFVLNHFTNINAEYYCIFIYNSSLCYMKLKKYDIALKKFKSFENKIKEMNIDKYYEVLLEEAVCFQGLKEYPKSLNLYNKILQSIDTKNHEKYLTILINLCELYILINKYDEVKETLNKILEVKSCLNEDAVYLPEIYYQIGKLYEMLNDLKNAENYYLESLKYAKKMLRYSLESEILCELIELYTNTNQNVKMCDIVNEFFILSSKEDKINNSVKNKLIDYFLNTKDIQTINEIHNFNKKIEERG